MECKSCGSVKFKKIRYGLYECEYCGRQVSDYNSCNELLQETFTPTKLHYNIVDPYRSITHTPSIIQLDDSIKDCERKIKDIKKETNRLKKLFNNIKQRWNNVCKYCSIINYYEY